MLANSVKLDADQIAGEEQDNDYSGIDDDRNDFLSKPTGKARKASKKKKGSKKRVMKNNFVD